MNKRGLDHKINDSYPVDYSDKYFLPIFGFFMIFVSILYIVGMGHGNFVFFDGGFRDSMVFSSWCFDP